MSPPPPLSTTTAYGRINYVSIYRKKAGTYNLTQTATLNIKVKDEHGNEILKPDRRIPKSTIVLVAPGDLAFIHIITDIDALQGFPVRTKISIVYELYDSYGNIIGPYGGTYNNKQ